jgi:hypothetical protein
MKRKKRACLHDIKTLLPVACLVYSCACMHPPFWLYRFRVLRKVLQVVVCFAWSGARLLAVVSADGLLLPPLAWKAEKNSKSRCLLLLCLLSLVGPLTCMQLTRELPGSFPGARRAAGFPPVAGGVTASGGLQVWTPVTPLLAADPVKD